MRKDVLFRGCTRPAMFMGVPYLAFLVGAGGSLMFAMWFGLQFIVLVPLAILVLRQMARRDELVFRLLALRWRFKFKVRNVRQHEGMWVLTPNCYRGQPQIRRG